MHASLRVIVAVALGCVAAVARAADAPLPKVQPRWRIEKVVEAPTIVFPTAIVAAPDGTIYLGQDPMDMPGPPTTPLDSVVAYKNGRATVFADKLWAVMGLEWADGALFVVHAPYLSVFRDLDGDGKAERREDLVTGLGPKLPGFNGINDHVASGVRLGMDGYLYISIGDKGIPRATGRDGRTITLHGGGVIRVRPDGTELEVVSTGERNPLSVAINRDDELFTYGNDDDSKRWPNSLTHHIAGANFGYPYEFLAAPDRTLPIVAGQVGGSGTQGICYEEDGLPESYRGNLFFCDWGLGRIDRFVVARAGGTYRLVSRTPFVEQGGLRDFRPFSIATEPGGSLLIVDWAFDGWLADGPRTGRIWRLTYEGFDRPKPSPRPSGFDAPTLAVALDHPSRAVRVESQRRLATSPKSADVLVAKLKADGPSLGRMHAIWALDALNPLAATSARPAIRAALRDRDPSVRLQAAKSSGLRRDPSARDDLVTLLHDDDASIRREAAIALGRLGDVASAGALYAALAEKDVFANWSIRGAIRTLHTWDAALLTTALLDPNRRDAAVKLCDEAWDVPVAKTLAATIPKIEQAEARARATATLAGLYRRYPRWDGNWFGTNPLAGEFPKKTEVWDSAGMNAVARGVIAALSDTDAGVRLRAIAGAGQVGGPALPALRARLALESDADDLEALAAVLGMARDTASARGLGDLLLDAKKPVAARAAALEALAGLAGPVAIQARMKLIFDREAPAMLVARALPALGRAGLLPVNDLAGFLENPSAEVRAAALFAIRPKGALPRGVDEMIVFKLDDPADEVKEAAADAVAALHLTEAAPKLTALASRATVRSTVIRALASLADPRGVAVLVEALGERDPSLRRAAEDALATMRKSDPKAVETALAARPAGNLASSAAARILADFQPVKSWRVIGPFARTTARVFVGERSIDFARPHAGAEGRAIAWSQRNADPATGRVLINDFKGGAGDRGGFGYDKSGSPDLCAFGYAEVQSDADRDALLLIGSSGTVTVTLNEQTVHHYYNFAGRAYRPDSDIAPVKLKKGANRLLVVTRQGIGAWSFGVQVSAPSAAGASFASKPAGVDRARLAAFALKNIGDAKRGETLFFEPNGIGCVKCHAVNGRGTGNVGPDLAGLSKKYDKAEIIRSVLEPSSRIATGYQPAVVALASGKVLSGVVRAETAATLELADAEAKITKVAKSEIEERRVGTTSVMPEGVVDALSVVDFADLIAYLTSLREPVPVKK